MNCDVFSAQKILTVWNGTRERECIFLETVALPSHVAVVCGKLVNSKLVNLEPVTRTVIVTNV